MKLEKKLLLLGLLQSREMHGYEINKLLEHRCGIPINLKKSNGYRLLSKMEKDGWITHKTEKDGMRPQKRVYSVTDLGKRAFLDLLKENLRSFSKPEFAGFVGLDFMGFLPPVEASALLSERLELLKEHFRSLDEISESVRKAHPSIEHMHLYYSNEIELVSDMIGRLGEES